jgi:hypothetical protein
MPALPEVRHLVLRQASRLVGVRAQAALPDLHGRRQSPGPANQHAASPRRLRRQAVALLVGRVARLRGRLVSVCIQNVASDLCC